MAVSRWMMIVLVRVLAEARTRVDADALARHAGVNECTGLVGQEAHDTAHDGSGVGQREAAQLRGAHVRLLAAARTRHDGGKLVLGFRGLSGSSVRSGLDGICLDGGAGELGGDGLSGRRLLGSRCRRLGSRGIAGNRKPSRSGCRQTEAGAAPGRRSGASRPCRGPRFLFAVAPAAAAAAAARAFSATNAAAEVSSCTALWARAAR